MEAFQHILNKLQSMELHQQQQQELQQHQIGDLVQGLATLESRIECMHASVVQTQALTSDAGGDTTSCPTQRGAMTERSSTQKFDKAEAEERARRTQAAER